MTRRVPPWPRGEREAAGWRLVGWAWVVTRPDGSEHRAARWWEALAAGLDGLGGLGAGPRPRLVRRWRRRVTR